MGYEEGMRLITRAATGVKWSMVSQVSRQGMQFLTTAVLAWLLSPSDFGLMGMAMVVIGFVMIFKDLGTSAAVIQRRDISDELLHSIFWINTAFGAMAMILLFATAPIVADFYNERRVTPLLQMLSVTFLISSIGIMHQAVLERGLAFRKVAFIEICATLSGAVIGIGTAFKGAGVWSLVYQTVAVVSVTTVMLWFISGLRPKMTFHWQEVRSIISYSMNLTGYNIFNYFIRNADYILIGKFLGAQELGYYTMAYRIMLYPLQNISSVIGRVMFPTFSQIQDDERFRRAYLKIAGAIALVTFPMMFGLWIVVKPFILAILGPQWTPVITLLMILAPVGMVQSIGTTVGIIYQAKGRTDWMFRWGIGAGLLVTIAFVIGLKWGIIGVASAYAIASIILSYPGFAIPFKLIDLPLHDLGKVLWRPFFSSSLMLVLMLGFKALLPAEMSSGLTLGILVPAGIIVYLLLSWLVNRRQMWQILDIVRIKA